MSTRAFIIAAILAAAPVLSLAGGPACAGASEEEARQALERGDIKPLDQVLDAARRRLPGDVVKVELERDDGRWTYEIKILTDGGQRREVEIDARSLRVLEVE